MFAPNGKRSSSDKRLPISAAPVQGFQRSEKRRGEPRPSIMKLALFRKYHHYRRPFHIFFAAERFFSGLVCSLKSNQPPFHFPGHSDSVSPPPRLSSRCQHSRLPGRSLKARGQAVRRQRFSNARGSAGGVAGTSRGCRERAKGGASARKDREGAGRPRPFRRYL